MDIIIVMLNRRGEPITNELKERGTKMSRVIDVDIGFAPMEKKELHQRLDEVRTELDKALLVYERKNPSYTIDQIETVLAGLRAINNCHMMGRRKP